MNQVVTIVYAEEGNTITIIRVDGRSKEIPASVHPNASYRLGAFDVAMKMAGWHKLEQQRTREMHHVVAYERD